MHGWDEGEAAGGVQDVLDRTHGVEEGDEDDEAEAAVDKCGGDHAPGDNE